MRGGLFSFQRLSVQLSLHQHGVTLLHCTGLLQIVASIRFSHQLMRHDDYFIFGIAIVKTSPACVDGTISILVGFWKAENPNVTPLDGPSSSSHVIWHNLPCLMETHEGSLCLLHSCYTTGFVKRAELTTSTFPKFQISFSKDFASELKKPFGGEVKHLQDRRNKSSCPNLTLLLSDDLDD